ncbi:MAG: acyl-[acyl-carrier-protein] thioesterase [Ilumatobacteraceae bacterium]
MTIGEGASTFPMEPFSGNGRRFTTRRRVRLGDATPAGRMRLDAIARFLQDIANDDARDGDWSDPHWWVVRRTVVDVHRFPTYLEEVDLATWCGGIGSHWAERRTSMLSLDGQPLVDAAALWVHVDRDTLQPSRVPADVAEVLRVSADGRNVGAKLLLKTSTIDLDAMNVDTWPLRFSDFDAVGHMNNAAYWEVLEEQLLADRSVRAPLRAVVEHVAQIEPGAVVDRHVDATSGEATVVLRADGSVRAAMWCGSVGE